MKLYADHAPNVRFTNQLCYACEDPDEIPEHVWYNRSLREESYAGYLEDTLIKARVKKAGFLMFYRKELHVMRGGLKHWAYEEHDRP